ncbi:MAG TPA: thioesterase family protein [Candidatus Angelobacter sp.]|nr:thioesterase family protein [Candidatus Angelobacter sp.]
MNDQPAVSPARQAADQGSFQTRVLVRFSDCDPAGIVFYPRYLEMFNNLVEDWCREGWRYGFDEIVVKQGWGLPTVRLEVDFVAPSRLGEVLTASLFVRKVGNSSIQAQIVLAGPDHSTRVRGNVVLVLIDRRDGKSRPFPEGLRDRIASFVIPA